MVVLMDTLALYEQFRGVLGEEGAKRVAQTIGTMVEDARNAATKRDIADLRESLDANVGRLDAALATLAEAQARTEKALENLARQVGGLSEAVGANLEDFACELVPELLEKYWGMTILSAGREEIEIKAAPHEFDLVVRGTVAERPVLVLGETKATVTPSEVRRFARLVETVRAEHPRDDIRPLFFGYRANRETQNLIRELGGSMVFTRGVMIPTD